MKNKIKRSNEEKYILSIGFTSFAQEIAQVKYGGGGDWYNLPLYLTSILQSQYKHYSKFKTATVRPSGPSLLSYPFIHDRTREC
jgi:hypothetical protein